MMMLTLRLNVIKRNYRHTETISHRFQVIKIGSSDTKGIFGKHLGVFILSSRQIKLSHLIWPTEHIFVQWSGLDQINILED